MKLLKYVCIVFVIATSRSLFSVSLQDSKKANVIPKNLQEASQSFSTTKILGLCAGGAFLLATGNALPCLKIAGGAALLLIPTWITTEIITTFNGNYLSYGDMQKKAHNTQEKIKKIINLQERAKKAAQKHEEITKLIGSNSPSSYSQEELAQLKQEQQKHEEHYEKCIQQINSLGSQIPEDDQKSFEDFIHSQKTTATIFQVTTQNYTQWKFGAKNTIDME